jgi:hypothetical protein
VQHEDAAQLDPETEEEEIETARVEATALATPHKHFSATPKA